MSLRVQERQAGQVTILDLSGRITLGEGAGLFRDTIYRLLEEGKNLILVNMSDVSYVDSSGIGEMVSTSTTTFRAGGALKYMNLQGRCRDLFQITKLYTAIDSFDDEELALAAFVSKDIRYCSCPVCGHGRTSPPFMRWAMQLRQNCGACRSRFRADVGAKDALVTQIKMLTYADEYLHIACGKPLVASIVGRLNRFAAPTLDRLWTAAPAPRRILFVLDKDADINSAGRTALLGVLDKSDGNDIAVASVEALSMHDRVLYAGHPRVYVKRAAALAALGPVEMAPEWRTPIE